MSSRDRRAALGGWLLEERLVEERTTPSPCIIWVYPSFLAEELFSAPTLEVTRICRQAGWQVQLLIFGNPGQNDVQGVDVVSFQAPEIYFVKQLWFHIQVIHFLRRFPEGIDILFIGPVSLIWFLPFQFFKFFTHRSKPLLVLDTRTIQMETREKASIRDLLRGSYRSFMNKIANHWVDGQTTITFRMAEILCIPQQKLWGVWPSGVNLEKFSAARAHRNWSGTEDAVKLVYTGILNFERKLMSLCKAVEQANREGMKFHLCLVGEGTEMEDLRKFSLNTEGRVQLVPRIPHEEIPELLARVHIGTLPFPDFVQFRVSSPIKLFEYMASGLPLLATRIDCHIDVIGNRPIVFWAESSAETDLVMALRQIWDHRSELKRMGEAAAVAAAEWTWETSAQKLMAAFEVGLNSRGY